MNFDKAYNLLIITSSGGGGLLKAGDAQEQEALSKNPDVRILKKDVLKDWVWHWLGNFSVESWNRAQQKGCVRSQIFYVSFQWLFDYLTSPSVFFHTFLTLMNERVDRVIDTQTTATKSIVRAIRFYNWWRSKQVFLEKVIVDLPTRKATHFFRPIKGLSRKDKKHLRIRTIEPLLEEGQTTEGFWQNHCGVSEKDIFYEDVNVRTSFRLLQGKGRTADAVSKIKIRFQTEVEKALIEKCFADSTFQYKIEKGRFDFMIPKEVKVVTILLGSQPATEATINYVQNFIEVARRMPEVPIALFVFCGEFYDDPQALLQRVVHLVLSVHDIPKNIIVVPFSFQKDDVIASLFHRSDITCSRSGGQTAMELMAVSTGKIWVHSETKKKKEELTLKELLKGIPVWESESALYLYKMNNAKIVTPYTFMALAQQIFTS